jgi:hypothetical protein
MKDTEYDSKLVMLLDIAKKSGMIISSLAKELGVTGSTVRRWRTGRHLPEDPDAVIKKVLVRARFLSRINLDTYDVRNLKKDFGLTDTTLGEELGMTGQGYAYLTEHGSEGLGKRKKELQEILRGIGRNWLKSVKV